MKHDQIPSWEKARGICVEVGTWHGGFAEALLNKSSVSKVYCVDPYCQFSKDEFPDSCNIEQGQFDALFTRVSERLKSFFGDRVTFLREMSETAASRFEDNSIDFIYIDANHEYSSVLADLRAWYPKLKKGGVLCGDDIVSTRLEEHDADGNIFVDWGGGSWGKYGVYKAIVDFGKKFTLNGTQFCIIKSS